MDLNTCFETTNFYHTIALYSHLVPLVLALFLSIYVLIKTKGSAISWIFFSFTLAFSIWLANDLVLWTNTNYHIIYFFWSWIDYMDVLFFILGSYFFIHFLRGKIKRWRKIFFVLVCIPAFIFTFTGNNVVSFDQTVCEAINNNYEVYYKTFVEWASIIMIVLVLIEEWKKIDKRKKVTSLIVISAILLFFAIFSLTEYVAAFTGIYEINLYGLFVLPVFLMVMVFSITNLGLFQFRLLGTQILAYVLIIMVGSQFLFVQNSTDQGLSAITLGIAVFLGILLLRNANYEIKQREKIEKLAKELELANVKLKELDQLKSEFLSLATHQIRAPLTAIKGYTSMLLEGDFGVLPQKATDSVQTIMKSCQNLINIVEDFLNISRIEQGRMVYDKSVFDVGELVKEKINEIKPNIQMAGLTLDLEIPDNFSTKVNADKGKIKQVIGNIIDNAIKYTVRGNIKVSLSEEKAQSSDFAKASTDKSHEVMASKVKIAVKDSGIGIDPKDMNKLFIKFSRAEDAHKTNIHGTGLGLYIAKKMVEAQGGDIKVFSEGLGKGSTFTIELPMIKD